MENSLARVTRILCIPYGYTEAEAREGHRERASAYPAMARRASSVSRGSGRVV